MEAKVNVKVTTGSGTRAENTRNENWIEGMDSDVSASFKLSLLLVVMHY